MEALPDWVTAFNSGDRAGQAEQEAGSPGTRDFYEVVGSTPAGDAYELDFARALITNEQLGSDPVTDMLVVSLSPVDLVGHHFGPDSPQERQMVDSLDTQLDSFFTWLEKNIPGGLANTWITLSADHGVAPVPAAAQALGMPAATIDIGKFVANLNDAMNAKFSPGEKSSTCCRSRNCLTCRSIVRPLKSPGLTSRKRSRRFNRRFRQPWLRSPRPRLLLRSLPRSQPHRRCPKRCPQPVPGSAPGLGPASPPPSRSSARRRRRRSGSPASPSWSIPTPARNWPQGSCPLGMGTAPGPQLQPEWRVVRDGHSGSLPDADLARRRLPISVPGPTTATSPWGFLARRSPPVSTTAASSR